MKERLVIENFGPIKHVDLNLNKINIFIGPNASGKSTISKIIAIIKSASLAYDFNKNETKVIDHFFKHFNIS
ncbi:MAG: AAA family ATPase, partial [Bacteroidales bacterium]|nr:AAA family ATPase [Bacteroidales bacterium]